MSEQEIIQNMIDRVGQSQDGRLPRELGRNFAEIDGRRTLDLLRFTRAFAGSVQFYQDTIKESAGTWETFFPGDADAEALLARTDGTVPPHLALFFAFLRLYKLPRARLNAITMRHLDFCYRRVLRFEKRPAVPDRAHVLIGLKKNAPPVTITTGDLLSAGKDATGVELVYGPTEETVVSLASIGSLRSVFLDRTLGGSVHAAPVANSSDGLGAPLEGEEPQWPAFGHAGLPAAEIGFALASPVLRMKEGERTIAVTLGIEGPGDGTIDVEGLAGALDLYVTGEAGWLGPYEVSGSTSSRSWRLEATVPSTEGAITDYDAATHGYAYKVEAPIAQFLLNSDPSRPGYLALAKLRLLRARISVEVSGITTLALESDAGVLDPGRSFLPFGPQPVAGSRFRVGYDEAFAKKLTSVALSLLWQGAPSSFPSQYKDYESEGVSGPSNGDFTVSVAFKDGGDWKAQLSNVALFDTSDATTERVLSFDPNAPPAPAREKSGDRARALYKSGGAWARRAAAHETKGWTIHQRQAQAAAPPPASSAAVEAALTLALERDFLHTTYRSKSIAYAMQYAKAGGTLVVLNDPYTPTVREISLSYAACSDDVPIASNSLADFSNPDLQFFHLDCFGPRREHGYQRQQLKFVRNKAVPLLPAHPDDGELFIGVGSLAPGGSVSVLFQAAEGSADPEAEPPALEWSVLVDNYWCALETDGVPRDTTDGLSRSGVIEFVIPSTATTESTLLPEGLIWLRAALRGDVEGVSRLIEVAANGVEVRFTDQGNDPAHYEVALAAGAISRLKSSNASVQQVSQPYASFGGRSVESDEALTRRAAERLRHRGRARSVWDYERLVLGAFPGVHGVKCIPHAKPGLWFAPGHVLLVVVPDLRNTNARDPLQPRVDISTLRDIEEFLRARCGMGVELSVRNPTYQKIRAEFSVKFRKGYEFNAYSARVNEELIRFLSPWAYGSSRRLSFGGRVYKSTLIDRVEGLDYVDYVTDFRMYTYVDDFVADDRQDVAPETPDAILVSDAPHRIGEAG
jgi:baseplate J-like protein